MRALLLKTPLFLLFLVAGILKLQDPITFQMNIDSFQIFPKITTAHLAHVVPPLEILSAFGLLKPTTQGAALLIMTLLSIIFAGLYLWALSKNLQPNCGCFGQYFQVTPQQGLVRAGLLSLLSMGVWFHSKQQTGTA